MNQLRSNPCGGFLFLKLAPNGIKLKADRLYKRFGDGGLILGWVMRCCLKNKNYDSRNWK